MVPLGALTHIDHVESVLPHRKWGRGQLQLFGQGYDEAVVLFKVLLDNPSVMLYHTSN